MSKRSSFYEDDFDEIFKKDKTGKRSLDTMMAKLLAHNIKMSMEPQYEFVTKHGIDIRYVPRHLWHLIEELDNKP
jgi:hypothetical protein